MTTLSQMLLKKSETSYKLLVWGGRSSFVECANPLIFLTKLREFSPSHNVVALTRAEIAELGRVRVPTQSVSARWMPVGESPAGLFPGT